MLTLSFSGETMEEIISKIEEFAWCKTTCGRVTPEESLNNFLKCAVSGDTTQIKMPTKMIHNRARAAGERVTVKQLDGIAHVTSVGLED